MKYFSVAFLFFALCLIFAQGAPSGDKAELTAEEICRLPMVRGRCRASIPHIYYDATKEECVEFLFGGCGGNENNFRNKEDCEAKCKGIKAA